MKKNLSFILLLFSLASIPALSKTLEACPYDDLSNLEDPQTTTPSPRVNIVQLPSIRETRNGVSEACTRNSFDRISEWLANLEPPAIPFAQPAENGSGHPAARDESHSDPVPVQHSDMGRASFIKGLLIPGLILGCVLFLHRSSFSPVAPS